MWSILAAYYEQKSTVELQLRLGDICRRHPERSDPMINWIVAIVTVCSRLHPAMVVGPGFRTRVEQPKFEMLKIAEA
jgi:hypothetical protein